MLARRLLQALTSDSIQMFACPWLGIWRVPQRNCSFFGGWRMSNEFQGGTGDRRACLNWVGAGDSCVVELVHNDETLPQAEAFSRGALAVFAVLIGTDVGGG